MIMLTLLRLFIFSLCLYSNLTRLEIKDELVKSTALDQRTPKCMLEDKEGNILIAGEIVSKEQPKWIYLELLDNAQTLVKTFHVKNGIEKGVNDLIQSQDGLYLVGGYELSSDGQKLPLVQVLDHGLTKPEKVFFSGVAQGEINDLISNTTGNILFTGQLAGKMCLGAISFPDFKVSTLATTEVGTEGNTLVLSLDGSIYIVGKKDEKVLQVWKYLPNEKKLDVFYRHPDAAVGKDAMLNQKGDIVIAGISYGPNFKEEALLLELPLKGDMEKDSRKKRCCQSGLDGINALVQGPSGHYYLAGYTRSHRRTAIMENYLLWKVSEDLETTEILCNKGGSGKDNLTDLVLLNDGSILSIGTENNMKEKPLTTCIVADSLEENQLTLGNLSDIILEEGDLVDGNGDGVIDPQERCFQKLIIHNGSAVVLNNLNIRLTASISLDALQFPSKIIAGHIKSKGRKEVYLPLKSTNALKKGEAVIEARLFSENRELSATGTWINFETRSNIEILANNKTLLPKQVITRSERNELSFILKNTSSDQLTDLKIELNTCGIEHISTAIRNIPKLSQGEKKEIAFLFNLGKDYNSEKLNYKLRIFEKDQLISEHTDTLAVRGDMAFNLAPIQDSRIFLLNPNAQFHCSDNPFRLNNFRFELSGRVVSKYPIDQLSCRSCKIIIQKSAESKEHILKSHDNSAKGGLGMRLIQAESPDDNYHYTFSQLVELPDQETKYQELITQVEMEINGKVIRSQSIFFKLQITDLYLVSIGIKYPNLKFTQKDANDIANIFKTQEGKLFRKVDTLSLTDDYVDRSNVERVLVQLTQKDIRPSDLLIFFISSHGIADGKGNYKLFPSNYSQVPRESYIDFQKDILNVVQGIQCKTLILVDACYSGAAKSGDALTLIDNLTLPQKGTSVLVSCEADQLSHECDRMQNGLFTEAILEGLSGKADSQKDQLITVGELFTYVRQRVPELVAVCSLEGVEQNPMMPRQEYSQNIPIYQLDPK